MSFYTQRLSNRFPLWTKIRRDPSAFGSRLLSTFAEGIENQNITSQKLVNEFSISKLALGRSFLYELLLEADDILEPVSTGTGFTWEYPTIQGTIGVSNFTLTRAIDLTSLLQAPPTRLVESWTSPKVNRLIWQSTDFTTYNIYPYTERLYISVQDSTVYTNKTKEQDRSTSGYSSIFINGFDKYYNKISETINIVDDGVYFSELAYKEVYSVITEGFDGTTKIYAGAENGEMPDPYRLLIFDDLEGPLLLSLDNNFITFSTNRIKAGKFYRRPGIEIVENKEALGSFLLVNEEAEEYTANCFTVSANNSYLYVASSDGMIYVYDHSLPEFPSLTTEESLNTYVEIQPLQHYAAYSSNNYLWTRFARIRHPIAYIQIYRLRPDGIKEFLQSDKTTWSILEAKIKLGEGETWKDFRFDTLYNQIGIWEYVCVTKTDVDTTQYVTAVNCGALLPIGSVDSGVIDASLIYFNYDGELVIEADQIYTFREAFDQYIIDERLGRVWLSDNYDFVEIS